MGNAEQEQTLLGNLLDPKPAARKVEELPPAPPRPEPRDRERDEYHDLPPHRREDFKQIDRERRDDAYRRDDRDDYGRGRPGYNQGYNQGRDSNPGGRRGKDGRSLC